MIEGNKTFASNSSSAHHEAHNVNIYFQNIQVQAFCSYCKKNPIIPPGVSDNSFICAISAADVVSSVFSSESNLTWIVKGLTKAEKKIQCHGIG